jgi:ATP-binding cassette subfamily F protein 1
MSTLYSDKIEIIINGKILINESDIVINSHSKYFIIGNNGCGKTTILNNIYNKLHENIDILILEQDIKVNDNQQEIYDFILEADSELYNRYKKMKSLEEVEELTDEESILYNEVSEYVFSKKWDSYEAESKKILNGLGFSHINEKVSILSGGWRMRLALGRALLRNPTILMLDEPTNHLDLDAVIWLTDYLSTYKNTLIIVTHQIHFVNNIADTTWFIGNPELTGNKLYTIRGGYNQVQKTLDLLTKETINKYEKFEKRIQEMKKKSTPKKDVDEFIKKNNICRPPKKYIVNIDFDEVEQFSNNKNIIEFRNIDFGYKSTDDIFKNLNLTIRNDTRMILVGPNGAGKTTLFKLASNLVKPNDGIIINDERLRVGYYYQQIIDNLPLDKTSIEYLQTINSRLDSGQCRGILGKLGIKKTELLDLPNTTINDLSGGQKARVSFSSLQISNPHLILLDEPSNHLDIESMDGLITGINNFNGGVVIITHDMYLIESIKDAEIYELTDNNVKKFNGEFAEYCDYKRSFF